MIENSCSWLSVQGQHYMIKVDISKNLLMKLKSHRDDSAGISESV